ncbi:MAG: aspartate 1-decarboxylase, partial [Candidatus Longimicrobiales bacterium M2_2A_002]
ETYVITGVEDSGDVVLNGAAARLVQPGDKVIIMSYAQYDEAELEGFEPRLVFVDDENRIRPRPTRETPGGQLRIEPA